MLLIQGIASQMIQWHEDFCAALAGHGLQVIRFDNRDVGRSSHFLDGPMPDMAAAAAGDYSSVSYTLSDMAADTVGLLDALGLNSAHIVGISLGGMIAQTLAIEHPGRVRSLTSISSTTGDSAVGQAKPEALAGAFSGPPATTRDEAIEQRVRAARAFASTGIEIDEAAVRERAGMAYDRNYDPVGAMRQGIAVVASGDRTERLRTITAPTLVIHGREDPMFDLSGGQATAAAIPGAELVILDNLGHAFPRQLWPEYISRIVALVQRAESVTARAPRATSI